MTQVKEASMKRTMISIALTLFSIPLMSGLLIAQDSDISGTWIGDAAVPGSTESDRLTLILEKSGDSYSGKLSDSLGLASGAPLEDVTFINNDLRFRVSAKRGGQDIKLRVGLNFFLGRLIGFWGIPDTINNSVLDLSRQEIPKK
jgi:hypothetical protein